MSERDTLAALLRDEYELGDYWVSKSRLADAAYRGRDPMDDWRGLADRLIAAGVRLAPADTGLREALRPCPWCGHPPMCHSDGTSGGKCPAVLDIIRGER